MTCNNNEEISGAQVSVILWRQLNIKGYFYQPPEIILYHLKKMYPLVVYDGKFLTVKINDWK